MGLIFSDYNQKYVIYQLNADANYRYVPEKHDASLVIQTTVSKDDRNINYFNEKIVPSFVNHGLNVIVEAEKNDAEISHQLCENKDLKKLHEKGI